MDTYYIIIEDKTMANPELKDTESNALEPGAMYCCVNEVPDGEGGTYQRYDNLVRYIGVLCDRHVFADADTWEECDASYGTLARQATPVIDPSTKGWLVPS